MPRLLPLALLLLLFFSCKRNEDVTVDKVALCLSYEKLPITNVRDPVSIYFYDAATGYVGGSRGTIYKTSDSARTFTAITTPATQNVFQVLFLNNNTGFAVGGKYWCGAPACLVDGGFIMKTTDGGTTWTHVITPTNRRGVTDIYFLNNTKGFAIGSNVIYSTVDAGNTWTETLLTDFTGNMVSINFLDDQNGLISCNADKFYTTTNGGLTWLPSPQKWANYGELRKTDDKLYTVFNGRVAVANSTNRWHRFFNSPKAIKDIHFIDDKHGYAFGGSYEGDLDIAWPLAAIYCTSDGGITWKGQRDIPDLPMITRVTFPTPRTGYGIGFTSIIRFSIK